MYYVLVIMIATSSNAGGRAIQVVPVESYELCVAAQKQVQISNTETRTACVRVKQ